MDFPAGLLPTLGGEAGPVDLDFIPLNVCAPLGQLHQIVGIEPLKGPLQLGRDGGVPLAMLECCDNHGCPPGLSIPRQGALIQRKGFAGAKASCPI